MDLETIWYGVIGISMIMYAVLDGFDLGVGSLHLLAKDDHQRRIFLNSIGPVWDGNEVWIVIIMGGLFAGFPNAYATIFSGLYTLLMFLIAGLIFRAAAIEFRSKRPSKSWRAIWDFVFFASSILTAFVIGIVLGNLIMGLPLDSAQNYNGDFIDLLHPYPILIGITGVALFAMHGAIYLTMKTEGETHEVVRRWINTTILVFLLCYGVSTAVTIAYMPHMTVRMMELPSLLLVPLLALLAILNIPYQVRKRNDGWAFISSCISIALLIGLFGIGTYPYLLYSTFQPDDYSLTIYNSASSHETLVILMIVVAIGVPLVLAYGFWVYRVFRGKVRLEHTSY
ncbi:MAG: cytochrome d ubiquinol oxidase subunit II [Verrucomicrobia bacterium]|nr:cytochrome d ubiquinol oxidase subunit II [Verrucomicrobiota bacterium]